MLTNRERLLVVERYTTKSDKTRETMTLLLSSFENKSSDLTVMSIINTLSQLYIHINRYTHTHSGVHGARGWQLIIKLGLLFCTSIAFAFAF